MGGGLVPLELAVAVAAAGALPTLSSARVSPAELTESLDRFKNVTDNPVAVNFLLPFLEDREAVSAAASRARVVEFFDGAPDPALVDQVHAAGALAGWQVGSRDEAVAAADAGCDVITAQGVEAGGHVRGAMALLPLLDQVLRSVGVPVLAAGGVGTGRDVRALLDAGAAGVRVGTRFVAAAESAAHPTYVQRLVEAEPDDTVVTEAFGQNWPNAPHRVLRRCVAAATEHSGDIVGDVRREGGEWPVPRWNSVPPTRATRGHIDAMALYAGRSVGAVRAVQPAKDILDELVSELG